MSPRDVTLTDKTRINLPAALMWAILLGTVMTSSTVVGIYISIRAELSQKIDVSSIVEMQFRSAMANPGTPFSDPRNPDKFFIVEKGGLVPATPTR
jgi:hypothetical protein